MINCREATRLASEALDHRLPLRKWVALKLHLSMCSLCRRFVRQLEFIRKIASRYAEFEADMPYPSEFTLSLDAKARIVRALQAG
jgi:hypothetical protein